MYSQRKVSGSAQRTTGSGHPSACIEQIIGRLSWQAKCLPFAMPLLDTVRRDIRYGWRSLRQSPGISVTALLTLALGMGANTAIFTTVHAVLMRPLDLPALDRLVVLRDDIPGLNLRNIETVAPIVEEYEKHPELFDAAGGYLKSGFALDRKSVV